jgi:membrane-bound serine protease (ClpP class)
MSATRSTVRALVLRTGALCLAVGLASPPGAVAQGAGPVYRIPVTGTIELGLAPFVARSLREAARAGAPFAILEFDTPGGRIDAAERIADAVRDAPLPVYAYVNRRAFSAGALISLACDSIFMRPGAVIGAATPVSGQTGEKLPEKYVSAMRGEFRALAEELGLDPRIAEGMVDEQIEIPGVKPKGQLLTLSTDEAVRLGVAVAEVPDFDALLRVLGRPGAATVEMRTNWAEAVVRFVSNPVIASLLMTLGVLGLVIELKTPHFGLAGLTGLACLALFFGSHWLTGLAGWGELILIGAGLLLVGVEIFVLPGFGFAGVLGGGAVAGGLFLSLIGRYPTTADLGQAAGGVAIGLLVVGAVLVAFLRHLPASKRLAGILHLTSSSSAEGFVSAPIRTDLVGKSGMAVTELRPIGVAEIEGERLDVTTEGQFISSGTAVTVVRAEDLRVVVRPVPTIPG